jgi:hypothetical protein
MFSGLAAQSLERINMVLSNNEGSDLCRSDAIGKAARERPKYGPGCGFFLKGRAVLRFKMKWDPVGDSIHMAGASSLPLWLVIMEKGFEGTHAKGRPLDLSIRQYAMGFMVRMKPSGLPTVWLPRSDIQGFFSHTGDSFRVDGTYVGRARRVVKSRSDPVATLCWWGDVGTGTLLYDRPNLRSVLRCSRSGTGLEKAIFGNPERTWWASRGPFGLAGRNSWKHIVAKGLPLRGFLSGRVDCPLWKS